MNFNFIPSSFQVKGSWYTERQADGQQTDTMKVQFFPYEVWNAENY